MRNLNKKGFFLSEAIIVGVIVTTVITVLYVMIINIINNYNRRAFYNNVTTLYTADNIRALIYNKGVSTFKAKLGTDRYYLVKCEDFADESSPGSEELCNYIYNFGTSTNQIGSQVVDKVLFTRYDVTSLKGFTDDIIRDDVLSIGTTTDYIDTIPIVQNTNDYRIILIMKERPDENIVEAAHKVKTKYWYTTLKVVGD